MQLASISIYLHTMSQQQRQLIADRARSSPQERQRRREGLRLHFQGSGSRDGLTLITSPSVESVMAESTVGRRREAVREPASSRLQGPEPVVYNRPSAKINPASEARVPRPDASDVVFASSASPASERHSQPQLRPDVTSDLTHIPPPPHISCSSPPPYLTS